MSLLTQFFLHSSPAIVQFDCLEITHPNFTTTYRIVRNYSLGNPPGVNLTHEGPAGPFFYSYYPMTITPIAASSDLTQALNVTLGDIGTVIQVEIAAVTAANKMSIRPVAKFRTYRSDDLTQPMFGPLTLEISNITCAWDGNTFECHAPKLNNSKTGQLYTVDQFPMLRGFF